MPKTALITITEIEKPIYLIRRQRVMLDSDLAKIYGVTTKRLNEQVKRNKNRFPRDFMFQLEYQDVTNLRSHFATSRRSWGGRRALPYAFSEHGAVMLANVLNSRVAIETNIQVVRAFVRLREFAITHVELARKINAMEKKYDSQFKVVFDAIRQLMQPPVSEKKQIGF